MLAPGSTVQLPMFKENVTTICHPFITLHILHTLPRVEISPREMELEARASMERSLR